MSDSHNNTGGYRGGVPTRSSQFLLGIGRATTVSACDTDIVGERGGINVDHSHPGDIFQFDCVHFLNIHFMADEYTVRARRRRGRDYLIIVIPGVNNNFPTKSTNVSEYVYGAVVGGHPLIIVICHLSGGHFL